MPSGAVSSLPFSGVKELPRVLGRHLEALTESTGTTVRARDAGMNAQESRSRERRGRLWP